MNSASSSPGAEVAWTRPRAEFSLGRTTGGGLPRQISHAVAIYQRPYARLRAGSTVLDRGSTGLGRFELYERRWEWLVAASYKMRPPLVGWQRMLGDDVDDVLLIHAGERLPGRNSRRLWVWNASRWLNDSVVLLRLSSGSQQGELRNMGQVSTLW